MLLVPKNIVYNICTAIVQKFTVWYTKIPLFLSLHDSGLSQPQNALWDEYECAIFFILPFLGDFPNNEIRPIGYS